MKLNGLDLFSGIGGMSLALDPWVRPIAYCENDRHATAVLLSRMQEGLLPSAPIWDDVSTLQRKDLPDSVGIVYGGFPCQDLSVAGAGAGLDGKRSGLVFDFLRIVRECRPQFTFMENVPAFAIRGLDRILLELDAMGYDSRWTIVSAAEMGAPHLRKRIWVASHARGGGLRFEQGWGGGTRGTGPAKLGDNGAEEFMADADRERELQQGGVVGEGGGRVGDRGENVADPDGPGLEVEFQGASGELAAAFGTDSWTVEPDVGRMAYGVPLRVDRLRGLGNAVVPQAARYAFARLMGFPV